MDETRIQDRSGAGEPGIGELGELPPARERPIRGGVRAPLPMTAAAKHVTGAARYTDDDPELPGTLQIFIAMSAKAHARILSIDLVGRRAAPGVVAVLTAEDIPGQNDYSPVFGDDPIFPPLEGEAAVVQYVGQPLFAVAAESWHGRGRGSAARPGGVRGSAGGDLDRRGGLAGRRVGPGSARPARDAARRRRCGARRCPAADLRPDRDRRPGPFLSRRPGRLRRAAARMATSWCGPRPSIPPRSSTMSRRCWACRTMR